MYDGLRVSLDRAADPAGDYHNFIDESQKRIQATPPRFDVFITLKTHLTFRQSLERIFAEDESRSAELPCMYEFNRQNTIQHACIFCSLVCATSDATSIIGSVQRWHETYQMSGKSHPLPSYREAFSLIGTQSAPYLSIDHEVHGWWIVHTDSCVGPHAFAVNIGSNPETVDVQFRAGTIRLSVLQYRSLLASCTEKYDRCIQYYR